MAKRTLNEKISRVFKLFEGLREERIAKAMSIYGMDKEDLEEGRRLIDALTQVKLDKGAVATDESGTFQEAEAHGRTAGSRSPQPRWRAGTPPCTRSCSRT